MLKEGITAALAKQEEVMTGQTTHTSSQAPISQWTRISPLRILQQPSGGIKGAGINEDDSDHHYCPQWRTSATRTSSLPAVADISKAAVADLGFLRPSERL